MVQVQDGLVRLVRSSGVGMSLKGSGSLGEGRVLLHARKGNRLTKKDRPAVHGQGEESTEANYLDILNEICYNIASTSQTRHIWHLNPLAGL